MASPEHFNVLRETVELVHDHKIAAGVMAYVVFASMYAVLLGKRLKKVRERDTHALDSQEEA